MTAIDELGLDASDKALLRSFVRSWSDHGQPVLFAGAGLSLAAQKKSTAPADARFGSWSDLAAALREDLTKGDSSLNRRMPMSETRLAELHEAQLRRARLLDRVLEAVPSVHFEPGESHRRIAKIAWTGVVTTNYDDLLERALELRNVRKVVWDADLTRRRSPDDLLVIKMHGDLQDLTSIVISEEDYRLYSGIRPGITIKVKQLFLEHPLLFVGFSLSDPNFTAIDGWIRDIPRRLDNASRERRCSGW